MQPKIEIIKAERVIIPKVLIQIEVSEHEFWKLLNRLQPRGQVYETYEGFYIIAHDIVYYAKRREA